MTEYQPNPNDVRIAVRLRTYPNTATEAETVSAIDRSVFDRVRTHEQSLVAEAQAARAEAKIDEDAAAEIASALRREVLYELDRPKVDLEALASRYKELRSEGEKAIRALEKAEADEAYRQPKLAAPYEDLVALWDKWKIVRPTI
ncbi:hypothetical protein ACIRCZ_03135 [Leifsonia sp. NPDC102414]|uniref:hypothetical protein n=1 Tax=Leifsonia sp. NPDC102414 TaxID=3364124 RepID=UPI0037FD46D5